MFNIKSIFLRESVDDSVTIPKIIRDNPKYMNQYELLTTGVEQGSISNSVYKNINFYLSRAIEKDFESDNSVFRNLISYDGKMFRGGPNYVHPANKNEEKAREIIKDLYYNFPRNLFSLSAYKKKVDALSEMHIDDDIEHIIRQTQNRIREWVPIVDAYELLKNKVTKRSREKEKRDVEKKEQYRVLVKMSEVSGIADILKEIVEENFEKTVHELGNMLYNDIKRLLSKQETRSAYVWIKNPYIRMIFNRVTYDKNSNQNRYSTDNQHDYELKHNADEIIEKEATDRATRMRDAFIAKNTQKLTNIISKKKIVRHSVFDVHSDFQASIHFVFDDGTEFTVRNKTVSKWSTNGTLFYQFPTTFHDVIFKDGTFRKMMSEQEMNEDWS